MNTSRTLILVLLAIAGTFYATRWHDRQNQAIAPSETAICADYPNDTPSMLTSGVIKAMIEKYKNTQLKDIVSASGTPVPNDAQAIWFDLETLKKFIYHIETAVAKNNKTGTKPSLGLRIYYAAYPDKEPNTEVFKKDANFKMGTGYENLHTLVMIPTISGEGGNNIDFNPIDQQTYTGFDKMATDSYGLVLSLGGIPPAGNGTNTSARNHGALYPPGASGGAIFY